MLATHPGGPILQFEHDAVMNLVADSAVTHRAITSGAWSQPGTWDNGVPTPGANVVIPPIFAVVVDGHIPAELRTVRVDGILGFMQDRHTELLLDTLVITGSGTLLIGTEQEPVTASARIVFLDKGPIDTDWDPTHVSRGLISHGHASLYGASKLAWTTASPAVKGMTTLTLDQLPIGWEVGDTILITGVSEKKGAQDEELRTILSISGIQIIIAPLSNDHIPPPSKPIYVANLTRNVTLESQSPAIDRRGHVMFMHTPHAEVHNVALIDLGRTDKLRSLHNGQYDAAGGLIPGTGTNQVGRYACHFHRTGIGIGAEPANISGCAVRGTPGWGIVNHSSYVHAWDNVVINAVGSCFVGEQGDEIGFFDHNLAVRTTGSGDAILSRKSVEDFGQVGSGFWLQGPGIAVTDNVSAGHAAGAFVYLFIEGLTDPTTGKLTRFPAHNLIDASIAGGDPDILLHKVPLRAFSGNVAVASHRALELWSHRPVNTSLHSSVVEDFTGYALRLGGILCVYGEQETFDGVDLTCDLINPHGVAFETDFSNEDMVYRNVRAEGWSIGIDAPHNGSSVIESGYLNCVVNINVPNSRPNNRGARHRSLRIETAVQFGTLTAAQLGSRTQLDIAMPYTRYAASGHTWLGFVFDRDRITYGTQQLYYLVQLPAYIFFTSFNAPVFVPTALKYKTTSDLWAQYRLAPSGTLAPSDTVAAGPRISGLIGSPVSSASLSLKSQQYAKAGPYRLQVNVPDNPVYVRDIVITLGWNVVVQTIGGVQQGFLIYGE